MLGKAMTVKWKLPTSYVTNTINLSGTLKNAGCTMAKSFATSTRLTATATSGKITVPKDIVAPGDVNELDLNLTIRGVNGETGRLLYVWGSC